MRFLTALFDQVRSRAFARVDIASLVFFRIAFGLLMVNEVCRCLRRGIIAGFWIEPRFLFKFTGFSWVEPWPGNGLYVHWVLIGVFALFIAIGFLYRLSAALFFLSYTYFFLLDQARYVNHFYLACLFGFLWPFLPAQRAFSVDTWLRPAMRAQTAPAWTLWLLRTQMGVVYFYGGVAKIAPDWLQGEPMRVWLAVRTDFPLLGRFFKESWAPYVFSYAGLLIDLLIVPLLLWRRTRIPAFLLAVSFHLINARLFRIDVFPWFAVAATTIFLCPSWPRRVLALVRRKKTAPTTPQKRALPAKNELLVLGLVLAYIAIQILVPLGHFLQRGGIEWTYMEHRFSWQMMLRRQSTSPNFYVTDPNRRRTRQVNLHDYLTPLQISRMGWRPDMIRQFAAYLATVLPRAGPKPLRVEARMLVSINGRKPQLFLDPNVDLAAQPWSLSRPPWLLEIHDPLPPRGEEFWGNDQPPLERLPSPRDTFWERR